MKKAESIQEVLFNLDFIINGESFVCGDVVIHVSELQGHSVDSFLEKMRRRGWLVDGKVATEISMLLEPGMLWEAQVNWWGYTD